MSFIRRLMLAELARIAGSSPRKTNWASSISSAWASDDSSKGEKRKSMRELAETENCGDKVLFLRLLSTTSPCTSRQKHFFLSPQKDTPKAKENRFP